MAEKRNAGFNIPLNFYDGPEVESIPKRIRAAAIGVWSLAGNYAATQLTDGYVGPGILKMFGCTEAIRAALKVTINKKGELSPLWVEARNGGIQLTNWPKHQRTNAEVTTYRHNEAERKRKEREARANATTSDDAEMSGRTTGGHNADVRADVGDPKTKTETKEENFGYDSGQATDSNGSAVAATIGAQLLDEAGIDPKLPDAPRLRSIANEMVCNGSSPADVVQGLRDWNSKTGIGPSVLRSLVSDVLKRRNGSILNPAVNGMKPATSDLRFAQAQALKLVKPTILEIES